MIFKHKEADTNIAFKWAMFTIFANLLLAMVTCVDASFFYCPYLDLYIESKVN